MSATSTAARSNITARIGAWWRQQRQPQHQQALRGRCPPATVAAAQIPADVRAAWAQQAPEEFPGLAVDEGSWLRCSLALAQFFEACRLQHEQGPCALPSKAADSVWHVWLKFDPTGLADWQQRYFGRVVEHREAADLGEPLDDCLARTWVGACRSEGLSPMGRRLPMLFSLDGQLGLPTGWAYAHRKGAVVHQEIDGFGRAAGAFHEHPRLAAGGLVALGLLTALEVEDFQRRLRDNSGGSSDGGYAGSSSSDCATPSGDGGGCSCGGSGCGGGGS